MFPTRSLALALASLLLAGSAVAALGAAPITGTVTDGTTGKPAGGDTVTLIQLQQGMQESNHTTTDAHGRFSLQVPDDGIHLVRVTHQKANYFQPVQPEQHTVAVTVYDAAPSVEGVHTNVEELHIEANATELHVVEVLQVLNESSPARTQFGPNGYDFYLPKGALVGRTGAVTQGGMPVQTPAVPLSDPGHYSFLFPIRPGETQFGIAYTVPYTGKFTFTPRLTTPVATLAVLLPTSMTLTPGSGSPLTPQGTKPGTQTFLARNVAAGEPAQFTVSGIGTLPEQQSAGDGQGGGQAGAPDAGPNAATANSDANAPAVSNSDLAGGRGLNNPLDQSGDRDPWAKYKWWILAGLALLLAGAAGVLLRKPVGTSTSPYPSPLGAAPPAPLEPPAPANSQSAVLAALKEELFTLETERLQRRISEAEYSEAKRALELILGRVLNRPAAEATAFRSPDQPLPTSSSAPPPATSASAEADVPALSGRPGA